MQVCLIFLQLTLYDTLDISAVISELKRLSRLCRRWPGGKKANESAKQSYKPSSVSSPKDGSHLSRPAVTGRLVRPTRGQRGHAFMSPYLALLRVGFSRPDGLPAAGELLTRHFTLARTMILSGPLAVCFCCTFRRVAPPGRYPAPRPAELGLSSRARRPRRLPALLGKIL
jgi:hypothetical protein